MSASICQLTVQWVQSELLMAYNQSQMQHIYQVTCCVNAQLGISVAKDVIS